MIISCAILTTLPNLVCASSVEPSYIPARLGMPPMSAGYRQNPLTSQFEAWMMVKLWNKECRRRGGTLCLVCWAWKTPQPLVSFWESGHFLLRNLCSRHNHISLNSALFSPVCHAMPCLIDQNLHISHQGNLFWNDLSPSPMSVELQKWDWIITMGDIPLG